MYICHSVVLLWGLYKMPQRRAPTRPVYCVFFAQVLNRTAGLKEGFMLDEWLLTPAAHKAMRGAVLMRPPQNTLPAGPNLTSVDRPDCRLITGGIAQPRGWQANALGADLPGGNKNAKRWPRYDQRACRD